MVAAQRVAIERAQMRARQERRCIEKLVSAQDFNHFSPIRRIKGGFSPGFKPIGESSGGCVASLRDDPMDSAPGSKSGTKSGAEDSGSGGKIADKKMKLAKFGMKFQSAGTLISIGDNRIEKDTPLCKDTTPILQEHQKVLHNVKGQKVPREVKIGGVTIDVGQNKASYTSMWEKAGEGGKKSNAFPLPSSLNKAPPPLMSRQRELIMEKAVDVNNLDDEDTDFTAKAIVKKSTGFKFKIAKK